MSSRQRDPGPYLLLFHLSLYWLLRLRTLLFLLLLLHSFNGVFSRTTCQKGENSLNLNDARADGVWRCSGINWTICKQSVPCSRQITTPTPRHTIFTGRMLFFLTPNRPCQSNEDRLVRLSTRRYINVFISSRLLLSLHAFYFPLVSDVLLRK